MERNQETLNDIYNRLEHAWWMATNLMNVIGNIKDAIEEARANDEYVPDISRYVDEVFIDDLFIESLVNDLKKAMKDINV